MNAQEWRDWQTVLLLGSAAIPTERWVYPDEHCAILAADRVLRAAREYADASHAYAEYMHSDKHDKNGEYRLAVGLNRTHDALLASVGEAKEAGR